jgi:hypothetical protein
LNYALVHEAIEQLLAWQLIEETRQEAGPGPVPKRFFGLTLKGLAIAFRWNDKDLSKHMDKVAERWGHLLPLVLGKWTYYKSAGLGDAFVYASKVINGLVDWGYAPEEVATQVFLHYIFGLTDEPAKKKWFKALHKDPELRQFAIKTQTHMLNEGRRILNMHERNLEALKIDEPDWSKVDLGLHVPKGATPSKRRLRYSRVEFDNIKR